MVELKVAQSSQKLPKKQPYQFVLKVNDVEISVVYYRTGYDPKHYENDVNKITPTPTQY